MALSVAKRPDGRWRARYRGADGKERAKHFDRKIDAERWLTSMRSKVDRGDWVDPTLGRITAGEWATTWLASKSGLNPTSRRGYEELWRTRVEPRWGSVALSRITYGDVLTWVAELSGEGLSPSRVGQALLVLNQILGLAVLDGRLNRNVAKAVKAPRPTRGEQRFLTHGQLASLADECGVHGQQYRTLVLVLGYTGLRWGEVRALRVKHVDLMRRRVDVRDNIPDGYGEGDTVAPKSHRRRTVPLPALVTDELAALMFGRSPGDLVFVNASGALLNNSGFRRNVFDPSVRAIGVSPFTPHNLRDTAASLGVSAGANVKAVQRMLGYASAAMTLDVYSSLFAEDLDDVAVRLNEAALQARTAAGSTPQVAQVLPFSLNGAQLAAD